MSQTVLKSARTLLRPFAATDSEELLAVFRDADVRRYLLDDSVVAAEWVDDEIAASDERFARIGAGLWSIRLARATAIIGFTGFREFFDPPQLQLLYALLPFHWGCGLATEAAARVVEHAFDDLAFADDQRGDRRTEQGIRPGSGTARYAPQPHDRRRRFRYRLLLPEPRGLDCAAHCAALKRIRRIRLSTAVHLNTHPCTGTLLCR